MVQCSISISSNSFLLSSVERAPRSLDSWGSEVDAAADTTACAMGAELRKARSTLRWNEALIHVV